MKKLIYSQEDLDLILVLELEEKDKVINDLLSRIAKLEYEVERLEKENDLDCNLNKSLLKDIDKAGKEIERLNNIISQTRDMLYKRDLDSYDIYTANVVVDIQSDFEEILRGEY